jgi:hypothetical protein
VSFSVNARAADKGELRDSINDKLDGVALQQSAHKADNELAKDVAGKAIDMLDDLPEGDAHEYSITIAGSLGWNHPIKDGETPDKFTTVNLNVYAGVLAKPAE